jgi:predicted O-linked N-acetylglucosamine transferase (SPINDLY family)
MKNQLDTAAALNLAIAQYQSNQIKDAEKSCKKILAAAPRLADALHLMGVIQIRNEKYKDAAKFLRQAILSQNDNPDYHSNLGYALQAQGDIDEAIGFYQKALTIKADLPQTLMNLGNALRSAGRLDEAEEKLRAALTLTPNAPDILYNLGLSLQAADKKEQARDFYQQALAVQPLFARAHLNLGALLHGMGDTSAAITHLQQALKIDPHLAEAHNNIGNVLDENGFHAEAIQQYQAALALDDQDDKTWYNLGFALVKDMDQNTGALEAYDRALAINPHNINALCESVHRRQHICDWRGMADLEKRLLALLGETDRFSVSPFNILNLGLATGRDHLLAAKIYAKNYRLDQDAPAARRAPGQKIKIGYVSADFCQHATAFLMAELFERHDRNDFEIMAYCHSKDDGSAIRQRLIGSFDSFVDIRKATPKASADRIREDGIDILIDLKGYTGFSRPQIFAQRPAPVQVNYVGYPGTLGAEWIDYIIGDAVITPLEDAALYVEKIVQLPHSYQPNDTKRAIAPDVPTRTECGLPEQGFVFCCFNNTYKILPAIFDVWMRLLAAVPGSVFWLFEANSLVKDNLRREAAARGVDPDRLIFAPRRPLDEHLARHACADLFLDTLPVNAHTTASDALWAGLPVLTCLGQSFAGRVAASLLRASHMPELITANLGEYESLALRLANDPTVLSGYRAKLQATRLTVPLFDIAGYTRDLEKAYRQMHEKHMAGKKPGHIVVQA